MEIDLQKPVLVMGASGFVGSHTARLLVERGRKVRVLLRQTSSRAALEGLPVEIVYGDVLDPASLAPAIAGCDTVFYSVVDPRFYLTDPAPLFRNNVDGLVNAMDAALASGIRRFVFTSTMGTLGINPGGAVSEVIPFNWDDQASPYIRARLEAENRMLAYCRDKGLPGVALCVANTYGPEDFQPTPHGGALWEVASGRSKGVVDCGQPTVDIRDVAEAALLAETRGRVGERYIIANEFVSAGDFYGMAVAETGRPVPKMMSYRLAYAAVWVAEKINKLRGKQDSLLNTDGVRMMKLFGPMDSTKARRELGWAPRPAAETICDAVRWFAAREASPPA